MTSPWKIKRIETDGDNDFDFPNGVTLSELASLQDEESPFRGMIDEDSATQLAYLLDQGDAGIGTKNKPTTQPEFLKMLMEKGEIYDPKFNRIMRYVDPSKTEVNLDKLMQADRSKGHVQLDLYDVFKHEELQKRVPGLKDVKVTFTDQEFERKHNKEGQVIGTQNAVAWTDKHFPRPKGKGKGTRQLPTGSYGQYYKDGGKHIVLSMPNLMLQAKNRGIPIEEQIRNTLMHEVQHHVQFEYASPEFIDNWFTLGGGKRTAAETEAHLVDELGQMTNFLDQAYELMKPGAYGQNLE